MNNTIKITGARIHNLKNIEIEIPKGKLTVITGVSGSGKSSLAFDILYEEGKRRYLLFSNTQLIVDNTRTFDKITGLSPTVAVEQRTTRQSNPRSTVGTRTKIDAMLAALFSAYGSRDSEYDDGQHLTMEMFQKNSPRGMCVRCLGTGNIYTADEDALFGDKSAPLRLHFNRKGSPSGIYHGINGFCYRRGLSIDQSIASLSEEDFMKYKYGTADFNGVIPFAINHYKVMDKKKNNSQLQFLYSCIHVTNCPKCNGTGLNEYAAHTFINGKNITQLEDMYINDLYEFLKKTKLSDTNLLEEIITKLECMIDVGLHHLALSRPLPTLSGGEIQWLFLASYIIAEINSIIFIFDESIYNFLPQFAQNTDPFHRLITIRHLLTMSSGIFYNPGSNYSGPMLEQLYRSKDPISHIADVQVKYTPGTRFIYKEWDAILLSAIISMVCNKTIDDVINEYLYTPLGINKKQWKIAKCGVCGVNCTCNVMTAVELAKIGRLMLKGGMWNRKRILTEEYIKTSVIPSEINDRYAFLWWISDKGYHGRGYGGQELNIYPDKNIVAVIQATATPKAKSYGDICENIINV